MRSFPRNLRGDFPVSTKQMIWNDTVLRADGKVLKRGWSMIASFTNTEDAVMRKQLFFSTGTIGIGFAVAALVAWSHSVTPLQATTASSSINPTQITATYKAPLPIEQWDAI